MCIQCDEYSVGHYLQVSRLLCYDCARIAMQTYVQHAAWTAIHSILHSVVGLTAWSVSCCRPAVLLLAVILLLYDRIAEHISTTAWLSTINRQPGTVYSVPAPYTLSSLTRVTKRHVSSFVRRTCSKQITADPAWGGGAHPNPQSYTFLQYSTTTVCCAHTHQRRNQLGG